MSYVIDFKKLSNSELTINEYILLHILFQGGGQNFIDIWENLNTTDRLEIADLLSRLEGKMYIKLFYESGDLEEIEFRKKTLDLFQYRTGISFEDFWNKYHEVTGLSKTDREPTLRYWKSLRIKEKENAINNIENYWNNLNDKRYCKKARTYLRDKNFNDIYEDKNEDWTKRHI
jgi:hypothetical protein